MNGTAAKVSDALEFTLPDRPNGAGHSFVMRHENGRSVMVVKEKPDVTPDTVVALKKYPHVVEKFKVAWGKPFLMHELAGQFGLMEEKRTSGKREDGGFGRQGFPPDVMSEIFSMVETHDRIFGLPPQLDESVEYMSKDAFSRSASRKGER